MEKIDQNRKRKITQVINFIEELAWLLDSKKGIDLRDFKDASFLLRDLMAHSNSYISNKSNKYESPNPNKNYLIGVLPNLFQDFDLFKTNIDLSDFAESVLKIPVSRAEKRSRYELIGMIICEIINLDEHNLTNLVDALSKLTDNSDKLTEIKEDKKKANFSWNEAIQKLNSL